MSSANTYHASPANFIVLETRLRKMEDLLLALNKKSSPIGSRPLRMVYKSERMRPLKASLSQVNKWYRWFQAPRKNAEGQPFFLFARRSTWLLIADYIACIVPEDSNDAKLDTSRNYATGSIFLSFTWVSIYKMSFGFRMYKTYLWMLFPCFRIHFIREFCSGSQESSSFNWKYMAWSEPWPSWKKHHSLLYSRQISQGFRYHV